MATPASATLNTSCHFAAIRQHRLSHRRNLNFGMLPVILLFGALADNVALALEKPAVTDEIDVIAPQEAARPSKDETEILERFVRECVRITPGTGIFPQKFVFGTDDREPHAASPREVLMSQNFRVSRYEVTQELYQAVMKANPSRWKGPRNSVESMTCEQAVQFCRKLTAMLHSRNLIGGNEEVRLPSEVEWEYCCRAGTTTRYSFGDKAATAADVSPKASLLDPYAWHTGNAAGNDPAVGILKPNPWGLCDCHGYLWEFTADEWTETGVASTGAENAASDSSAAMRTVRGGSWKDDSSRLTSTSRQPVAASASDDAIGFRCLIAEKPQALTH